jgi:hypothetical protein
MPRPDWSRPLHDRSSFPMSHHARRCACLAATSAGGSPPHTPSVKTRTLGRWRWRWRSGVRGQDIPWRRSRSLRQRRLPRSLDPASPNTVLLTADWTNVAARARLRFLRMRNHAESRNDERDACQAYDRHCMASLAPSHASIMAAMRPEGVAASRRHGPSDHAKTKRGC